VNRISSVNFTLRLPFASFLAEKFPSLQDKYPNITEGTTFHPFKFLNVFTSDDNNNPGSSNSYSAKNLLFNLIRVNKAILLAEVGLAASSAFIFYAPAFFMKRFLQELEDDPRRGINPPVHFASFISTPLGKDQNQDRCV
jgi:hypothetical protein